MEELEKTGCKKLHHVEPTHDASAPVLQKDVHIKKVDRSPLLKAIEKGTSLHHVSPSHDASKPVIEKDVHIKKVDRSPFLKEVVKGTKLHHVEKVNDTSVPHFPHANSQAQIKHVMDELIQTGRKKLRKTKSTRDASAPVIEKGLKIKKDNSRKQLMQEIKKGKFELKKTTTNDRSAPILERDVHIKKSLRPQLMKQIIQGYTLHKPGQYPMKLSSTAATLSNKVYETVGNLGHKGIETVENLLGVHVHVPTVGEMGQKVNETVGNLGHKGIETVENLLGHKVHVPTVGEMGSKVNETVGNLGHKVNETVHAVVDKLKDMTGLDAS